jgi:hypothetical protein
MAFVVCNLASRELPHINVLYVHIRGSCLPGMSFSQACELMPIAAVKIIQFPMLKIRWTTIMLQIHSLIREHPPKRRYPLMRFPLRIYEPINWFTLASYQTFYGEPVLDVALNIYILLSGP